MSFTRPPSVRLKGVPKVGSYPHSGRPPETDPLPACLLSYLEYLGHDLGLATPEEPFDWHNLHVHLMALCGTAFRIGWDPKGWSSEGLAYFNVVDKAPERTRKCLELMGCPGEVILGPRLAAKHGEAAPQDWSVDFVMERACRLMAVRGVPAIFIGLVAPGEPCLVTGYDKGGRVLYGWSHFTGEDVAACEHTVEEDGQFRCENWLERCDGLILPGPFTKNPDWRALDQHIFRLGRDVLSQPRFKEFETGLAASTRWAESLLDDTQVADPEKLQSRHICHWVTAGALAECRAWASWYLTYPAERNPEHRNQILDLVRCFSNIHDLVWAIWEFTGSYPLTPEKAERFADGGTRRRIVPLIRMIREQDEKALALLEEITGAKAGISLPEPPEVGYHKRLNPLCGSLEAICEATGSPVDYDDLLSVTGGAFRRFWNPEDGGNVDIQYLHPEPLLRVSRFLEREVEWCGHDEAAALALIRRSLLQGLPAIAFGLVGPPEAGLVTGVSADGKVASVSSWFNPPGAASVQSRDWFDHRSLGGRALAARIGDSSRWHRPDPVRTLASTVRFAIQLMESEVWPGIGDHLCGIAALRAWRGSLMDGRIYDSRDRKILENRGMVFLDQLTMSYERGSAAAYLRRSCDLFPRAKDHLLAAAEAFAGIPPLVEQLHSGQFDFVEVGKQLSNGSRRSQVVEILNDHYTLEVAALASLKLAAESMA